MRITVTGCGYLGATHAACMAELGFDVLGVEVDGEKLALLQQGRAPFHEPELDALLDQHVASGRLRFTASAREAAGFGDVHFLCVGTPQQPAGLAADLSYVDEGVRLLAPHLRPGALVVGKSTVPVGTAQRLAGILADLSPAGADAELAWNPEFLREGHAVDDTLHPDRLVFGVASRGGEELLRGVFAQAIDEGTPVVVTDYATAELVKVAANAFLATKVSFINAVAEICEVVGADVSLLADALGHDQRIGRRFLSAGIGYGGGCLPKDIRAFQHRAGELGADDMVGLLREVEAINLHRRQRVVELVHAMVPQIAGARVAVLGAAFKPHSDDIRDSPALQVAGQLQLAGAEVTVYDPAALGNAARLFPTLRYADTALQACERADIVLHLTEWPEFGKLSPADLDDVVAQRRLLDGRNALDPATWRDAGWDFHDLGRR
jgi:UDPglucose 6-dehydrogenase